MLTSLALLQVRMLDHVTTMDEQTFSAHFVEQQRTWSVSLSNKRSVPLKPDGDDIVLEYDDRHEYCELVQRMRMSEFDRQVEALLCGLLSVVPRAVLDLLTWQELERRVCGNPEISLEALRKTSELSK